MNEDGLVIGIDVAKGRLDVAVLAPHESLRLGNDRAGWAELLGWLNKRKVKAIGLEPSGGYERGVARALRQAGLPVRSVNPYKLRHYARALGRLAKNDRIDASLIARYTAELPTRPVRNDPVLDQLADLVVARRQMGEDKVSLKNQLEQIREPTVRRLFNRRLERIKADILCIEKRIAELVESHAELAHKDRLIQSMLGAGPVLSHTLIALVPELGLACRRQIAALIGLAPYDHESGSFRGKRCIWGGRAEVRRVVYMAGLVASRFNPTLAAFHQRLIAAGKAPKLAIIATARKLLTILNAMLRKQQTWAPNHA